MEVLSKNAKCQYGYRPYIDNKINALNPCFLSLVIFIGNLLFILVGLFQLWRLSLTKKIPANLSCRSWKSISMNHLVQLSNVLLQVTLIIVQLSIVYATRFEYTQVLKCSLWASLGFAALVSVPTQYLQYFKSNCAIGNQLFYYFSQTIILLFQVSQRIGHWPDERFNLVRGTLGGALELALLVNGIAILTYDLCFYKPAKKLQDYYKENDLFPTTNIFANLTYTWMNPLITETYKHGKIKDPRHMPIAPINLHVEELTGKLRAAWENETWIGRNSLFRALLKVFGRPIVIGVALETTRELLDAVKPQFLMFFILCFNVDSDSKYPPLHGLFIAVTLFFLTVLSTVLQNQYFIFIFEAGLGMKGSLISLIYQKSLRLSVAGREKHSTGDIMNLISVDARRVQMFFEDCQVIISSPLLVVVVLISLYWLLGKAAIAGLVTLAIMIPINSFLSKRVESLYKTQMKYKDTRIRTTTEILNSMKSIKLYAWEKPMLQRLNHVRNDLEVKNFAKIGVVENLISFAWNCVPLMVSCSTFVLFSFINSSPLSPEIVFPALSLFELLNEAIYSVPNAITNIIETKVSVGRLKKYLLCEELDDSFMHYKKDEAHSSLPTVEINNATFLWKSEKSIKGNGEHDEEANVETSLAALKNIDHFEAKKGALTCVVGRVGSGKSTLLRAVLGQLPCISGSQELVAPEVIVRAKTVAYCPQSPWVMNASIKDNILFGHRYDENYYNLTIKACQLIPDLKILADGDETLVGEKGISLSGGQKARLSLARAVYARADLYLMDDILSAVDAEVSKNIIDKVLDEDNGLLKNKTIILTTNAVSVLKHSNMIYALQGGQIVEEGTYEEAISRGENSSLQKLIKEFDTFAGKAENEDTRSIDEEVDKSKQKHDEESLADSVRSLEAAEAAEAAQMVNISSRRASMATFRAKPSVEINEFNESNSAKEEKSEHGKVKKEVYIFYIKSCGLLGVVLFFLFMVLGRLFELSENFWLKYWSESNQKNGSNNDVLKFVGIYALIGIASTSFDTLRIVIMLLYCSIRGSKKLHDTMARSILRSPMTFFETTPIGRIINRFSSDMGTVDDGLQFIFSFFFRSILNYCITVLLIGFNMPWFLAVNAVLLVVYLYYQAYYITLSRELKRLASVTFSPIMSLVSETLGGHMVITAFRHVSRFYFLSFENTQIHIDAQFHLRSTNRWLSVRLQTIGAFMVLTTALLTLATIGTKKQVTPGMVGLLMSYALQVTSSLMWIVRMSVMIETNIVSVERIYEYCQLPSEAPAIVESMRPDRSWPAKGNIVFKDYSTKYKPELDPVLKGISLNIKPREKIGVVGRTGAGKSTLSLALFRLLESTEGSIEIDGLNIAKIGLYDLRSHLSIIPQDAQAFQGTVRSNMDPFDQYPANEIWKAVELSHLKPHILKMFKDENPDKPQSNEIEALDVKISENGDNLSMGQRQLLCLSRALLNKSKVLVLDEATAAVDMETDQIIQETIRSEFQDRTILTIAHRIDTVLDSDKILVLDKGQVKEFDTPANLLSNKKSMFYSLCQKGGYLNKNGT
ncbi:ZYBA0S05-07448g1_1 [Zygosaccharomyces bailii CLIB 213]|uniref:ZYBA0S05-07448g1_1 n=1 Tax=Zygosaccharomyces bailii (strain CLIB 213 / ATCC 58445 / CBS 680 / BCRC 21525 / NBRC 1098 / NCYC 1416 / NRRL Y-2227) TaxID=1333698 RepID=A0A8J2T8F0_ZYGB2|nr:ZYBA0S05-07448g1_1 [Zygosaccharomyces bailii CLIB 213]